MFNLKIFIARKCLPCASFLSPASIELFLIEIMASNRFRPSSAVSNAVDT